MKYIKKPVEVEARQLATSEPVCLNRIVDWVVNHGGNSWRDIDCIYIQTLEGEMRADVGDWIIQGVAGEFYPCKPEIFAATYDRSDEPSKHINEPRQETLAEIGQFVVDVLAYGASIRIQPSRRHEGHTNVDARYGGKSYLIDIRDEDSLDAASGIMAAWASEARERLQIPTDSDAQFRHKE